MSSSPFPLILFPSKPVATSTKKPFNSKSSFNTRTNRTAFKVSCNNVTPPRSNNDENQLILPEPQKLTLPDSNNNVDRRNLLVGLGGLYTAANLPAALASPITGPDNIWSCKTAVNASNGTSLEGGKRSVICCAPSLNKKVKKFELPNIDEPVRIRWPAHKGTEKQIENYKKAIKAMRALKPDHPHSFESQAKIHCAYCNGGYTQVNSGFPDINIQIHNSWLFFPFHRWYLYFYERILGKLINDPTFALPYWNWDSPEAGSRVIPEIFLGDDKNPLYDVYRNALHLPPTVVDLNFSPGQTIRRTFDEQIRCNLKTVYKELVSNATSADDFFGSEYVAGKAEKPAKAGSVEGGSHTAVHVFVGDSNQPFNEDMGNFYSAGYDPLFYVHHANVDRMWKLWKDLKKQGPKFEGHVEPKDEDWLNASYVFYDENEELVRVYNKDSVDLDKLKFNYQPTEFEITDVLKSRPTQRSKTEKGTSFEGVKTLDEITFPVTLDKIFKVRVKRPKVSRTDDEKLKMKEVLTIDEIKYGGDKFVKFDVFVNDNVENTKEGEKPKYPDVCSASYAGTFARISHGDMREMTMKEGDKEINAASFVLTELFEDTKTDDKEDAVVAFVPKTGCESLTISGISISLEPIKT